MMLAQDQKQPTSPTLKNCLELVHVIEIYETIQNKVFEGLMARIMSILYCLFKKLFYKI